MAKVTDLRINISENGEKIQFETPVNVTKEGIFTTTLPRNAVDEIEKYGLTLRTNRLGNPGYFEAKTLDELTMSVKKVCREALSRELVEDKMIITSLQQEQTPTEREIAEAHRYAEMIRERDKERIQQEQLELPTIKGWIARDDADRLGLYDQKPTRKTELGAFSGTVHSWVIGDTWIGRFSLDQTAKTLFPNLCWTDDPMEVELMFKPVQEQPEVDLKKEYAEFVEADPVYSKLVNDVVGRAIARHFYELGMAVGDLKIKGWVERDMGGQVILTVPNRGAADEYILLENNTFPNLRPDNTRIEVDLIIRKK